MPALDKQATEQIDAIFADMSTPQHPGAAVLVVKDGQPVFKRGYGFADVEAGRLIETDSSFYLASLSKQFTAMAIMMLAEQRLVGYDETIATYLTDLPSWGALITVRQLLQHTSGLPDYTAMLTKHIYGENVIEASREVAGVTNLDVLRLMQEAKPEFPAGAQYKYSNSGYVLLALLVEQVSGQAFSTFLKQHIFDPLGMQHTLVYEATRPTLHQLARGYIQIEGNYQRWEYPLLTTGDGGIFSMIDDLVKWDAALNTEQLVTHNTLEQAFTSGTTNDGNSVGYGFGWMTNVYEGARHVAHGGSLWAYNNYIIRLLDTPLTIAVLTNHQGVPGPRIRAHQIAEIVL